MKAKTQQGRTLKRLATEYANAFADLTWMGAADPEDRLDIIKRVRKAKKTLFDKIDEVTGIDLTPRAVSDR